MYNDTTWQFPDTKFLIGRYLVPDINFGSAMTAKIISMAGEVVPQSTLCPLMIKEMENPDLK